MDLNQLNRLEDDARRTLRLKEKEAAKGHDWVVDSHSLTSTRLLELVALARLGYPLWKRGETYIDQSGVICQNSGCPYHKSGRHTHEDGTIHSPPLFS